MRTALLLSFFLFTLLSCKDATNDKEEKSSGKPASTFEQDGTDIISGILSNYIALKDAFVAEEVENIDKNAELLEESIEGLDTYIEMDSAYFHLQPVIDGIKAQAAYVAYEHDMQRKRSHFKALSDEMYDLLKDIEYSNANVYYQHCPMAFDNSGAYWLSMEKEIRNPYFGDKMLTCGSVKETLN